MVPQLGSLYGDQDLDRLRFRPPNKFVFLCGGVISDTFPPTTLRDYLLRTRKVEKRLKGEIVLAEAARDLYRETLYKDLVSFEEDIARIASLVLVIPESPGSLAELGAFATNDVIRRVLCVIMQERFEQDQSFIRLGPIENIIANQGRDFVGFYPWRLDRYQRIVMRSISPHYTAVVDFINQHLDKTPSTVAFRRTADLHIFYVTYWVINLLLAVSSTVLTSCVSQLLPGVRKDQILNKLYCMRIAGWIKKIAYSHKDYYYSTVDGDPFSYSFKAGARERDSVRRKVDIAEAMRAIEEIPPYVLSRATTGRRPRPA